VRLSAPLAACGLAVALSGCPKRQVETTPAPVEGAPQVGTLFDRWEDVDLALYAELAAAPGAGLALRKLAQRHDVDRFTAVLTTWSPPARTVIEIEDTSSPTRESGAFGAWILHDGPVDVGVPEAVSPDALLHGEASRWVVGSVLLRDWPDAPRGADPFDLLLADVERLPPPWSVCRPRTAEQVAAEEAEDATPETMPHVMDPVALHAHDHERGVRIGLRALVREGEGPASSGSGPYDWTFDHIELSSARRPRADVWAALGFADCVEIGRILGPERARRPKQPLGPPS
jgi:hypothetical protein